MTKEHKKKESKNGLFEITQRAVIYDSSAKKFLLVKYSGENEGDKADESWSLIGGRMHDGENSLDALKREIEEEIGKIDYEGIGIVDSYMADNNLRIAYLVNYKSGEIKLSEEHESFVWLTMEEIEKEKLFHGGVKQFINSAIAVIRSQEYLDGWKRCQADFENYKKRQAESQKDLLLYASQNVILQVLPILDNFHVSTDHIPEDQKNNPWVTGIMYIQKQLEDMLKENGVEEIEVYPGDSFDPTFHEATRDFESKENKEDDNEFKNIIRKVVQKGYRIDGKIIRAARVIVE
jgi:molecular chaperone GrpE (heat shock protein)